MSPFRRIRADLSTEPLPSVPLGAREAPRLAPSACRSSLRTRLADDGGFTLVETLVAFVVLATVLSVLFRSVVGLHAGANAFDMRTHADLVARAILEETLAKRDLKSGSYSGVRDGRAWTLQASPVDLASQLPSPPADDPPAPDAKDKKPAWAPQRLIVRVETGGGPVEIETIRLAKAPPA